jgi:acyl-CoA reductase-like NAD-dependent aldehyde dehydrogenase
MQLATHRHAVPGASELAGPSPASPSSRPDMDAAVTELGAHKAEWAALPIAERLALIARLRRDFAAVAESWIAASCAAKGLAPGSPQASEEGLAGAYCVLRNLRLLEKSLAGIAAHGRPDVPGPVTERDGGQVVARVFPQDFYDRLFYAGVIAEAWMQPGVTKERLAETQAVAYSAGAGAAGGVALVLGAGNVSSIGPMDALYKLFVDNRVVLYKAHPVNDYLGPLLAESFRALGERGFFRVVYGGAEAGAYLCSHPGVDEIHITGSDRTYEAIVFGPGEEGRRRKQRGEPILGKPISAELGNVSPVIVVPGPWEDGDFVYQAESLVTMLANNAGFNCNATRVILTHAAWPGRERLLAAMREVLVKIPPRKAYYPGAAERFVAFAAAHPEAERFGARRDDLLPWMLVPGLDSRRRDDICFTTEAFCSLFGEAPIEAASPAEFLQRAVAFANDALWGTLNATLIVHPGSLADPETARAVEQAIAELRYGTVCVNHWAAAGYALVVTPWGAFPGHTPTDIQSGTGVVHNTLMFSRVEKGVVRAPFRVFPKPAWFATHRAAGSLVPRLVQFEASPSIAKLPGIFSFALRG